MQTVFLTVLWDSRNPMPLQHPLVALSPSRGWAWEILHYPLKTPLWFLRDLNPRPLSCVLGRPQTSCARGGGISTQPPFPPPDVLCSMTLSVVSLGSSVRSLSRNSKSEDQYWLAARKFVQAGVQDRTSRGLCQ